MNPSSTQLCTHGTKPRGYLLYVMTFVVLLLCLPRPVKAQCSCSDGSAPLTQVESYSLYFATGGVINMNLPKFDASKGTLVCVGAQIYLTSAFRYRLENEAPREVTYHVPYLRLDSLFGPGITPPVSGMRTKTYGPVTLQAADAFPNSGPDYYVSTYDTVYNNVLYEGTTTNVVDYLGTGNVTFQYKSRVFTNAEGSDSNQLGVGSVNNLRFYMTYNYCPNSVLAQNIKNFNAVLKDKENVIISWTTQNESKNNSYEIELSHDGKKFRKIGTTRSKPVDGAPAKYEYQYHIDKLSSGRVYFRVRQLSPQSAVYSEIRSVTLLPEPLAGISVYPNPVIRNINMEFAEPVTGDFQVQVSNQMGQVVHSSRILLNKGTRAQVIINDPPPPGVYYLRAKDMRSEKIFNAKLLFGK